MLKFDKQPYHGSKGAYLTPYLTATMTSDGRDGSVSGTFSASALVVDAAGKPIGDVLAGAFNATGECDRNGTAVTFKWKWLSVMRDGVYRFHVTVVEFVAEQSMFVTKATGTTEPFTICGAEAERH